jgi:SnoaL-like domain
MDESFRRHVLGRRLTFDAMAVAPSVSVPTLMVHAAEAALPDNVRRFFSALAGPKHLFWTVGAQTDFYDREPQVGLAVDVAVAHFRRTLGAAPGAGTVVDRQAVSDAITRLLHAIDKRDWAAIRAVLAEQVTTDYTSLFGGSSQTQSVTQLIESWRAVLPGFDPTQHLTGPILAEVFGDAARAHCAVTAVHRLDGDHWTVSGHYDIELARAQRGWAISSITYHNALVVGDKMLPAKAQARARLNTWRFRARAVVRCARVTPGRPGGCVEPSTRSVGTPRMPAQSVPRYRSGQWERPDWYGREGTRRVRTAHK